MANESLGLDVKNGPSNGVDEGTAVPEKTTEQGKLETEEKPVGLWMKQLPKELQENEILKGFNTIGDLAKAVLKKEETDKGGVFNKLLGDNEKEWEEFKSEFAKEGKENTGLDDFIKFAKDSTLTPKQAKAVLENSLKVQQETMKKRMEDAPKRCTEFLHKQWGDGYDKGVQDFKKGVEKLLGDDEFSKSLKKNYENDPYFIEIFRRVGALYDDKPKNAFMTSGNYSQEPKDDDPYGYSNLF